MRRRWLLSVLLVCAAGCTHCQLSRSTVRTASTINAIEYQMVLDNLALFSCNPAALPWHVRLADGTVQISDKATWGQSGGFTTFGGSRFGIEQWGPGASRQISEQWGVDAVRDPVQLQALQVLYRRALGLPPLPEPNFIAAAKKARAKAAKAKQDDSDNGNGSGGATLGVEEYEVPVGWFHVGSKHDVPKHACYVGNCGDCYVWVTPEGTEGLARFTLAVLAVVKLEVGTAGRSQGLAFTP